MMLEEVIRWDGMRVPCWTEPKRWVTKALEVLLVAIESVQIALLLEYLRRTIELVADTGQS